jgi:hypothetical protein
MKKFALLAALAGLSLSGVGSTPASANLIQNPSFEDPPVGSGSNNCLDPPGPTLPGCFGFENGQSIGAWTVFGDLTAVRPIVILSNSYSEPPGGAPGSRFFTAQDQNQSVDLTGASNQGQSGVVQTVNLSPGTYELSFWIGRQGTGPFYNGAAEADLLINNILQDTFSNTLNDLALNLNWQQFTFSLFASGPTTIAFRNASLTGGEHGQNR